MLIAEDRSTRGTVSAFRKRNVGILRVTLIVLVCAVPLFTVMDYFTIGEASGEAVRDLFVQTDVGLFVIFGLFLAAALWKRRFFKRRVAFLFGAVILILVTTQVFLLYSSNRNKPFILFVEIVVGALLLHTTVFRSALFLLSNGALASLLVVAGVIPFLDLVPPLAAVTIGVFVAVAARNHTVGQSVELRRRGAAIAREKRKTDRTLKDVQALKAQQDADYYLTTLLLGPLITAESGSPNVKVDYVIKQKKEFGYKDRNLDIGGDFCYASPIRLRGRTYTVIVNADAMGKSIQGAGGALVLGTVLRAIIARTRQSAAVEALYPERWLKSALDELQSVFVSFRGTMLASLAFGIVDDRNGFFYFVNAEHPRSILYRGGQASFLEDGGTLFKLGSERLYTDLRINTIQLRHDDVIILGSDGRDDLILGDGTSRNDDETLILKFVEAGEGDCSLILRGIAERARTTDDLSLLSLAYLNPGEAAESTGNGRVADLRNLWERREYAALVEPLLSYIDMHPGDTEKIVLCSYALRKVSRFPEAIDLGERVRLRDKTHLKNLVNLGKSYLQHGNRDRAKQILRESLLIDPAYRPSITLLERLQ